MDINYWRLLASTTATVIILLTGCSAGTTTPQGPWNVEANCIINNPTPASAAELTNPYTNGYRLHTEVFENSVYLRTTTYEYDTTSNVIYGTKRDRDGDILQRSEQYINDDGFLIGGVQYQGQFVLTFGFGYQVEYNAMQQINTFITSGGHQTDFRYEQDRLAQISSRIRYTYNDRSIVTSVHDSQINLDYYLSCDEQNKITDIYTERDSKRSGHNVVEYDENGNVIVLTRNSYNGRHISTRTFTYQASDDVVFNHGMMRSALGLIYPADDYIH